MNNMTPEKLFKTDGRLIQVKLSRKKWKYRWEPIRIFYPDWVYRELEDFLLCRNCYNDYRWPGLGLHETCYDCFLKTVN